MSGHEAASTNSLARSTRRGLAGVDQLAGLIARTLTTLTRWRRELTQQMVQVQATLADSASVQGISMSPDAPVQTELAGALDQLDKPPVPLPELADFLKAIQPLITDDHQGET